MSVSLSDPPDHRDSRHFLLANEYWAMRMGEDEGWTHFRKKVEAYESVLNYTRQFDRIPERRKIDMWIGRLPSKLVERVRVRTNDLLDIETVEDLFAVLQRIEDGDYRVASAADLWAPPPPDIDLNTTLEYMSELEEGFPESQAGSDLLRPLDENCPKQYELDLMLSRLPRNLLDTVRQCSHNFHDIEHWDQLLPEIRKMYENDLRNRRESEEQIPDLWELVMEEKYAEWRGKTAEEDWKARRRLETFKAGVAERAESSQWNRKFEALRTLEPPLPSQLERKPDTNSNKAAVCGCCGSSIRKKRKFDSGDSA
ncbi:uncharacterized protein BKA78DRAFT_300816 [Phyllosticta capitalensis]|uniref:uncharacterized protein n=1 Tax=Phyllosticta capitalensis TaxID=121624 RepID=UPI00313243DB